MSSFKGTTDDHPTSSKAIEHASSLAHDDDGSVHTTLMKLFRPKSNPTGFNPSATPATATRKSPRKLKVLSSEFYFHKPITMHLELYF